MTTRSFNRILVPLAALVVVAGYVQVIAVLYGRAAQFPAGADVVLTVSVALAVGGVAAALLGRTSSRLLKPNSLRLQLGMALVVGAAAGACAGLTSASLAAPTVLSDLWPTLLAVTAGVFVVAVGVARTVYDEVARSRPERSS